MKSNRDFDILFQQRGNSKEKKRLDKAKRLGIPTDGTQKIRELGKKFLSLRTDNVRVVHYFI